MNKEPNKRPAQHAWSRRERWLSAGLILVSAAFAIEWSQNHERGPGSATRMDNMATQTSMESTPIPALAMEPLSDEADPEQARNIHVPGRDSGTTSDVVHARSPGRRKDAGTVTTRESPYRPPTPSAKESALLSEDEINARLAELESMEWGTDAEKKMSDFIRLWAKQDPIAAMEYALGIESNRARTSVLKSVFGDWMKSEPDAARAWFNDMLAVDPLGVDALAGMVFKDLVGSNPLGVITEISKLPGNSLKRSALASVASQLMSRDELDVLFEIHDNMAPGLDQDLLTEAILKAAGIYEPTMIAEWALKMQDAHSRELALDGIVRTWSSDQPISASEWVATLRDDTERSRSIATVTKNWARVDAVATAEWLLSMKPPSPSLDPALGNFVKAVMKENPSGAMAWAGTISDEKQRSSLMIQVGKQWIKADRETALAFVNQTPLPESVVNAILAADPEK